MTTREKISFMKSIKATNVKFLVLSLALGTTQWMPAFAEGPDQEPIPGFYQEPGVNPNRDTVSHSANEHIDPFTGKLQWHFVDFAIPGNGGLTLKVQRSYSSRNEDYEPSPIGIGWTMHFGRVLRKTGISLCDFNQSDPAKNPVLELADGSRSILYLALGGGSYITTQRWRADCATGSLRVFSPDGTRYDMDIAGPSVGTNPTKTQSSWYVSKITDRNGNYLTFTYTYADSLNFGPLTVAASDGRNVTFEYLAGKLKSISDGSRIWSYLFEDIPNYPGGYHLTRATRPDGRQWQYEYNPPGSGPGTGTPGGFSMKRIIYPTGGQIDYTYGFVTFNPASFFPLATTRCRSAERCSVPSIRSTTPTRWTRPRSPRPTATTTCTSMSATPARPPDTCISSARCSSSGAGRSRSRATAGAGR